MGQDSIANSIGSIVAPYRASCGPCDDSRPGPLSGMAGHQPPARRRSRRMSSCGLAVPPPTPGSPSMCGSLVLVAPVGACTSQNSGFVASQSETRESGRLS
jgi:hypothetical protein